MTDMGNVISVIVVLVFATIVFRKRLAPFFKNKTKKDTAEPLISEPAALPDKEKDYVYINVFAVDAGAYLNMETLSDAIGAKLHKELDLIYRTYVGSFIGIDVVTEGDLLLFLVRWHT